jgi:predicted kinase
MAKLVPKPHALILVCGAPGAGKSTLARALMCRLAGVWLNSDAVIEPFFGDDRDSARYKRARPDFFAGLYAVARMNLETGNSVLLDIPHVAQMRDAAWRRRMQAMARKTGARLVVLKCVAGGETLKRRLRARGEKRDRVKLRRWAAHMAEHPPDFPVPLPHAVIDMEQSLGRAAREALAHVVDGSDSHGR